MKKAAVWTAVLSITVFIIAWAVVGLRILDGNYDITAGAYIALIALVVFFVCIIYVKSKSRCAHCGKMRLSFGKYCPYCGKEVR